MSKRIKNSLAMLLAIIFTVTTIIPAYSTLVAAAEEEVVTTLLDFEDGESYTFGPNFVPGYMGVVTTEKTSGEKSFRRDWKGKVGPYENFVTFSSKMGSYFDFSDAELLALDFYIDNVDNWNLVYDGRAGIEFRANSNNATYKHITIPSGLNQGWNTIEIKISELGDLDIAKITDIKITPLKLGWWGNDGGFPNIPSGYDESVANVSLRVDNIRKIKNPKDKIAPTCNAHKIDMLTVADTFVIAKLNQFADNKTSNDKLDFTLYASESPINIDNVATSSVIIEGINGAVAKISDLKVNTAYYFAVKCTDEAGNFTYLFNSDPITTKSDNRDIATSILDFEDDEKYTFGPNFVPGYMGVVTTEKTSGEMSFRRDWKGKVGPYENFVIFSSEAGSYFDFSDAEILAIDLYIDNIDNWNLVYDGRAGIEFRANANDSTYKHITIPSGLKQGWNTIEISISELGDLDIAKITDIKITPLRLGWWGNDGGFPNIPSGYDESVANVSLRIDNIRKIKNPKDKIAPTCNANKIDMLTVADTFVIAKLNQFADNQTAIDKLTYCLYVSENPINESNVEACEKKIEGISGDSVKITDLKANTAYYFSVKCIDEADNFTYLFNTEPIITKSDNRDIVTPILDFEDGEKYTFGPNFVPGYMGVVTTEKTSGEMSFRRDWKGKVGPYENFVIFSSEAGSYFDFSDAEILAIDLYIDNIENWNLVYDGSAGIEFRANANDSTYKHITIPKDLKQGWNTIEINMNSFAGLEIDKITDIKITPIKLGWWGNDGGSPTIPSGYDESVANVSLRIDNIRKIKNPIDRTAPIYYNTDIVANAISGTHIKLEFPQFSDNISAKENLIYTVYASKTPLDSSNVESCANNVTVRGILLATLTNLTADTDYYFALKCTDEAGNSKYLFFDKTFRTSKTADYFSAPIFSCESLPTESYGPTFTTMKGYNADVKTEGKASLMGTITNRPHYENLIVAYRQSNPIDMSKCNVLSLDLYIDDIDVYNTHWKNHLYLLITNDKNAVNSGTTLSYITFELGDLVEGWNSLQLPLDHSIDLSTVWALRISTHKQWQNDSGHNPGSAAAAVSVGIDNVRGEYIPLSMDKTKPVMQGSYLQVDHISNSSISILHSEASDNITNKNSMVYEIIVSEEKITSENVSTINGIKVKTTGRSGEITDLKADTEYYFAVCAIDEAGNKSDYIIGKEGYKTYSNFKDHWYMLTDCDKESGVTYYPDDWVPRVPSFTSETVAQGTTAITKTLANNSETWHNVVTINSGIKKDIGLATRVDFKLYIESLELFEEYWYGHLYFVITDAYGQYAAYSIPKDIKEGWNDISVSLYGKDIDLTNISELRITPVGSNSNDGSLHIKDVEEGVDISLRVAIDYITAVYDASLLPTLAPTDSDATYITNCDAIDDGGYWNMGVTLDEFEKTEGAASVKKTFGYGFIKENTLTYVALEPMNMNGAESLLFDLYVSNIALLKNRTKIVVKLGSSQRSEEKYIAFNLPIDDFQVGWNQVQIELDSAFDIRADFDIENIILFSLYCEKSIFLKGESVELRLDNIRMAGDIGSDEDNKDDSQIQDIYPSKEPNKEYSEEIVTETKYETEIINKTQYHKSEPINKISVKTYTHNKGYQMYIWVLAIAVPIVCICGLVVLFITDRKIKRRKQ